MTQEGATPPDFWRRVEQTVEKVVARYARSGANRNSSIGDGGSFTLRGGIFRLLFGNIELFYVGPVKPSLPDGSAQQGFRFRRSDGSTVLLLRDAFPDANGTTNQALTWQDRLGNIVIADDTDSGFGIARPWIPGAWHYARAADWPGVTSGTFETIYRAKMPRQHPRLRLAVWGWNDTAAATGEIRVMLNGVQFGPTVVTSNGAVGETVFGPTQTVGIPHTSEMTIEIQARLVSGAGAVRCCPSTPPEGRQS